MSSDNESISRATFFRRHKKRRLQDIQHYKGNKVSDKSLIQDFKANEVHDESFTQDFEVDEVLDESFTQDSEVDEVLDESFTQDSEVDEVLNESFTQNSEVDEVFDESFIQNSEVDEVFDEPEVNINECDDASVECSEHETDNGQENNYADNIPNFLSLDHSRFDTSLQLSNDIRVRDILVLTLALSVRHSWTYENIVHHLQSQNALVDIKCLPKSKKELWKTIRRDSTMIRYHAYCNKCLNYLGLREQLNYQVVCECGNRRTKNNVKYFITLDLKKQFQQFLTIPGISDKLKYRQSRKKHNPNSLQDIFDGQEYNKLLQNGIVRSEYDYTYVFNLDGVKITKGAKLEALPIYIRINELPPNLRQKYLFLAGVWVDTINPIMNVFLKPFVEEANYLSSVGVEWKADNFHTVRSRFIPTCHCVDSKERWKLLNMTQYNGYFGCTFCDILGVSVNRGIRYPILPNPEMNVPQLRTNESILQNMIAAYHIGTPVKGVKGPAPLMNLHHYGLLSGSAVDDLHAVHEGNAQHHTELLLKPGIGALSAEEKIRIINARMRTIKTPTGIARKPQDIKRRAQWKGSEWRNWLFYYSIPCLTGLIPHKYINHLAMLSFGTFLLSQDEITRHEMNVAENCLLKYVTLFEEYFGIQHMYYNVHLLLHFTTCVRNWGSLWVYSTFDFESWNNKCIRMHVTSPQNATEQIIHRHLIQWLVHHALYSNIDLSGAVKSQLETLLTSTRKQVTYQVGDIYFLGKQITREPSVEENIMLNRMGIHCEFLSVYHKILYNSVPYTSIEFTNPNSLSNDSIIYTWEETFCSILRFVNFNHENREICGAFVLEHEVEQSIQIARHIVNLKPGDELHFLLIENIRCPAVSLTVQDKIYLAPVANHCQID